MLSSLTSTLLPAPTPDPVFPRSGAAPRDAPAQPQTPGSTETAPRAGSLEDGGFSNVAHVQGVTVATASETARRVRGLHARGPSAFAVHLSPSAQRKSLVSPGGIEAVVGADRVVPEELLAAVCAGFCPEREEKHRLEKSRSPDAETQRGRPGLSLL